ncbi:MAG: thiamine monophosphate kinase [Candidatus Methanofastidiosum methylothiophilum]|uniref:Thiamine monophosphate kinase n=1 Tax=Candidatus Methanofastidiosum methylothiophilum TaxID=1705564 RepID=A0A150IP44_9EURY|nr:MAG: thiamine monophosphate kinase [Candidatus Methanofastidiosum methylthiophilus]KYC46836.1 MAG: thiamine monophosphate kinase [Candidatus Methanofastidiosum methylthiophilus]
MRLLPDGKVDGSILSKRVFPYLGSVKREVIVGPNVGIDAAVIDVSKLPGKMVVSQDPITGAGKNAGFHVVNVCANDVASMGARPMFFLSTIIMPKGTTEEELELISKDIERAAKEIGISIVGGHTEISSKVSDLILSGTMIGFADRFVSTSGAKEGDDILLTKGAGIEGTAILADSKHSYLSKFLDKKVLESAMELLNHISVVKEALIASSLGATALHDPTEGGIIGGLNEIADASNKGFEFYPDKVHLYPETKSICEILKINPFALISSGALMIISPKEKTQKIIDALEKENIKTTIIGKITKEEKSHERIYQDELWRILDTKL